MTGSAAPDGHLDELNYVTGDGTTISELVVTSNGGQSWVPEHFPR